MAEASRLLFSCTGQHTNTSKYSAPSYKNLLHPCLESSLRVSGLARLPAHTPGESFTGFCGHTSSRTKLKTLTQNKPYLGSWPSKQVRYFNDKAVRWKTNIKKLQTDIKKFDPSLCGPFCMTFKNIWCSQLFKNGK